MLKFLEWGGFAFTLLNIYFFKQGNIELGAFFGLTGAAFWSIFALLMRAWGLMALQGMIGILLIWG